MDQQGEGVSYERWVNLFFPGIQIDDFCVELDVLMSAFSPSIKHDRYTVRVLWRPSLFRV